MIIDQFKYCKQYQRYFFFKLVYSRLKSSSTQFDIRKGISTEDAILEFLDDAYNSINKFEYLAAVWLDLSEAFFTVNHATLLWKLHHLGLS